MRWRPCSPLSPDAGRQDAPPSLRAALSDMYAQYPAITYVAISEFQARQHSMPRLCTIYHGVQVEDYRFGTGKREYLAVSRPNRAGQGHAPGHHVARQTGMPLKIAGEIQPDVPRVLGTRDGSPRGRPRHRLPRRGGFRPKNELLAGAAALLFPIQWDEPFGLVVIESMACGTPVLALPGGSMQELLKNGVNGYLCADSAEMAHGRRTWTSTRRGAASTCRRTSAWMSCSPL